MRLEVCVAIIVVSAAYGVIVVKDPVLAQQVWRGYIAAMLTVLVLLNVWKKP